MQKDILLTLRHNERGELELVDINSGRKLANVVEIASCESVELKARSQNSIVSVKLADTRANRARLKEMHPNL